MPLRKQIARALVGALIVVMALVSVGLTASADGPFSIGIRPVFLRLDETANASSPGSALGLDVDIKLGTIHLHIGWSAIPLPPTSSTKTS